ncbi:hypothetical protein [Mesorhizobium sp. IMUNJ 23232]|uniref:hypothetical protein n=1 Tax=Mesorhizobium sp. IMUNJ 23232 TaxID=3376064 RepID=UPI003798AAC7
MIAVVAATSASARFGPVIVAADFEARQCDRSMKRRSVVDNPPQFLFGQFG